MAAAACAASFGVGALWAQGEQARTRREPQFENEHVRAWKSIILPKQPLALHRHEKGTRDRREGGRLKVVDQDGETLDTCDRETGKAYWLDAEPPGQMHGDVNDTSATVEVIVVELK